MPPACGREPVNPVEQRRAETSSSATGMPPLGPSAGTIMQKTAGAIQSATSALFPRHEGYQDRQKYGRNTVCRVIGLLWCTNNENHSSTTV